MTPSHRMQPRKRFTIDATSPKVVRLKNALGTAGITYFGMALSLVSSPLVARALGAEGRGVLAAVFAAFQVLAWVSFLGLPRAAIIFRTESGQLSKQTVKWIVLLGCCAAVLLSIFAPLVSGGDERIIMGIRGVAWLLVPSGVAQLGMEVLQTSRKYALWNITRSVPLVLPSLLIIGLYVCDELTLRTAILATASGQLIWCVCGAYFVVREFRNLGDTPVNWRFGLNFWSASLFDTVGGRIDQLLLIAIAGPSELGVYAVALTCAAASGALAQAIGHVAFPDLIESSEEERSILYKKQSARGIIASTVTAAGIVSFLYFYSAALFGPTYEGLVGLTLVLSLYQLLNDQWHLLSYRDSATGDARSLRNASIFSLIVLVMTVSGFVLLDNLDALTTAISMVIFACSRIAFRLTRKGRNHAIYATSA